MAATIAACSAFGFNLTGDKNSTRKIFPDRTVLTFTQDGQLKVEGSGTVELLLVGGGGGGGRQMYPNLEGSASAGGGGGGGVVHLQSLQVTEGTYPVKIGKGGEPNQNGGDTEIVGINYKAYGGGGGADVGFNNNAGNGASGGGGTTAWGQSGTYEGGRAIYGELGNSGHNGGASNHKYGAGGGGGAGGEAKQSPSGVAWAGCGGDGLLCPITGDDVYYGAGGGASRKDGSFQGEGGLGGADGGEKGTDGWGAGGGGEAAGGSGTVIVSFVPDAPDTSDFLVTGGDRVTQIQEDTALIFTQDGNLTVKGAGTLEVLLVGGGGGGGKPYPGLSDGNASAGGGGGGGVVHLQSLYVTEGTYPVIIGKGGELNENGGDTEIVGISAKAYGGGGGADVGFNNNAGNGASGGGGAQSWGGSGIYAGGRAIYGELGNRGHDGGSSSHYYGAGGGGGAGGDATPNPLGAGYPGKGGDGLLFAISGGNLYYGAGGGASRTSGNQGEGGLGGADGGEKGTDGLGAGGGGYAVGGSGTVVVRFKQNPNAFVQTFEGASGGVFSRRRGHGIHRFNEDGTFVMPTNGIVEILVVGGGGGGGRQMYPKLEGSASAGGGGGGGVVHYASFGLPAGTYPIVIGKGGEPNLNGGDTKVIGLTTAYGGGAGADVGFDNNVGNGASGGGGAQSWGGSGIYAGGRAIYGELGNSGHDGGSSSHYYGAGGGGGAGGEAKPNPLGIAWAGSGGDGLLFSTSGTDEYYGGGGGASRKDGNYQGKGGLGGADGGEKGDDGVGAGGGGEAAGGSGTVIIRYKLPPRGLFLVVR